MSSPQLVNVAESSPLLTPTPSYDQEKLRDPEARPEGVNEKTELEKSEWQFKVIAFVCSCLLSVGSHYAANMLSALKSTLKEELGISNAQYGLLQSAVSLVNTVIPFFGGIFIDAFGTGPGSILASSLIFFGDCIVALSTHLESFPVMVVGRVIYGVGSGCIVTVQEAILAHWFKGRSLAVTLGFQIAMSRLSNLLATGTVVPISEKTGFYGNAFWVSASICGFSWLINLLYIGMLWYMKGRKSNDIRAIEEKLAKKSKFKLEAVYSFPTIFWLIAFLSFSFGGTWGPYLHISPELIKFRFGSGDAEAAWQSTAGLIIPVIVSPFAGYAIDRWGQRSNITLVSALLLCIAFPLLGYSTIDPMLGLVIFSFSYTLGPVSLISSIPLVLDVAVVGTALGVYKCASNIGSTLVDPLIGVIQDHFQSYDQVMLVLIGFAVVASLAAFVALLFDIVKLKALLNLTREKRLEIFGSLSTSQIAPKASKAMTYIYVAITAVLLIASWGVYISLVIVSQAKECDDGSSTPNCTVTP